ncbi:prolyl oligopeptidase family serine peptidase [Actinoplanes sp. LDG1-06]|uniref:Prolyl oligopeptidase family serine peptidase n=1 Tax=Paractinoplanes ovalisporus TaxID=2810368 RepID=A0ABS2AIT3_9ACTN|nr:prolyl oligopeptidase family serine peptidase [Actinoplanes ovalisporus]MBM2619752.1 prolyl oligopeptidase family serine peptidase [Actinoplanes ovalisporus]
MATPISRRTVLTVSAGAAAGLALPGAAAQAGGGGHPGTRVSFELNADVLDGGEQVTSVTLQTSRLGRINPSSLTTGSFSVHAKATSPIPLAPGDQIYSEYDLDRAVTSATLDRHGDIVLKLEYAEGKVGGGTLGYIASKGRNVQLDLVYTITQNSPLVLRDGRTVKIQEFRQGRLANPEVDAFSYGVSRSGMKYRLYEPHRRGRGERPLVVWLHGGGEGASLPDNYYDNETTLRANRGALGFATAEAQRIFDGAYVVAPQSQSFWMEDGPRFAPQILQIIQDLVRRHPVDKERIYVVGCSNGGYMSMEMTVAYPDLFAASVPICGVVQSLQPNGPRLITDADLAAISTPTWLVTSRDDTTVPPAPNTIHAHDLIPGSRLTLYDHVIWNGYQYAGHWSWIYVARNDPAQNGQHIWQWMSKQRR